MAEIVMINLDDKIAMDEDGRAYPITSMFDRFGEETDDPAEASAVIADGGGCWLTLRLSWYAETIH